MDGTRIDEIADGIYRISTWLPAAVGDRGISINRFLVLGEEPLLFHTGRRRRRGGAGCDRWRRAARTAALAVVRPRRGRRVRRHERDAGRGPAPGGGVRGPGLHDLGRRPGRPAAPPAGPGRRRRPGRPPAGDGADAARRRTTRRRRCSSRRPPPPCCAATHPAGRRSAGRGDPSGRAGARRRGRARQRRAPARRCPRPWTTWPGWAPDPGDDARVVLRGRRRCGTSATGRRMAGPVPGWRGPPLTVRDRREADTPSGHG